MGLARVLITTTKETPPIPDVKDHNAKGTNHRLVHLVPVLAEDLWERPQEQERVALVVMIPQEVPTCHLAPLEILHPQVRITLELKVVLTRTDTSILLRFKPKVIT